VCSSDLCISVTSNVAPKLCAAFQAAMAKGDYAQALAYQDKLMPLHRAMFLDPNPAGPKYLASVLGKMKNELRLPLVEASASMRAELEAAAKHAGIL
jgi:4-hydroxy-tetrahydrodipicolinate synthase